MDYGISYTEKQAKVLEKHIRSIYTEAKKDINGKLKDFNARFKVKDAKHKADLKAGLITKADYQSWLKGQVFQGDHWKQMRTQMESILTHANEEAINIVNGGKIGVIANNANYMAYTLEHGAGVNFGFALYDTSTVTNLLKEQPDLLPNKHVDPVKDGAWNRKKITRQVTLGILEGESTDQVADRLANVLSAQDQNAMLTTARTAMTSAQNAGRQLRMEEAVKKGIKLHKEWMCTLDLHTRTAHRELDGQKVPIDKPFKVDGYEIRFPADPQAEAYLIYNCRCAMVADLDDYPSVYQRYDNIDGVPVDQMTYKEWAKAKGFVKTVATSIDYSKFGGKEVYDIIKKYKDWDEFQDLSDYDTEWRPVTEAFLASDPDATWKDIYGEWKKEIDKLETGAVKQTAKDAIDYSEFGGKEAFEIFAKYEDSTRWMMDYESMDEYSIISKFIAEKLDYDYDKADELFAKAHEIKERTAKKATAKATEKAIDYSEFGGKDVYDALLKYDKLDDFIDGVDMHVINAFIEVSRPSEEMEATYRRLLSLAKSEGAKSKAVGTVVGGMTPEEIANKVEAGIPRAKDYIDNAKEKALAKSPHIEKRIQNDIQAVADDWGIDYNEAKQLIDDGLKAVIDNSDFTMRIRSSNLQKVLEGGSFKNQFETGTSGGAFAPERRKQLENEKFNVPKRNSTSMSDSDRPVYGMFCPKYDADNLNIKDYYCNGAGSWYGDGVTVVLKKENVINQATMTIGDSLDYDSRLVGTEVNNPSYAGSWGGKSVAEQLADIGAGNTTDIPSAIMHIAHGSDEYFEYQLHGAQSHSADNIAKVYMDSGHKGDSKLLGLLNQLGIPYEFYS